MSQQKLFELVRDAGLPVSWWRKTFEAGEHREWRELQQFVKLIVRECISLIETSKKCDPYTGDEYDCHHNDILNDQIAELKYNFKL